MAEMVSIEPCAIVQVECWPGMSGPFEAELLRQLERYESANLSESPLPAPLRGEGKGEGPGEARNGQKDFEAQRPSPGPSPYLSPQAGRGVAGVVPRSAAEQPSFGRLPSAFGEVVSISGWQAVRIAPRRFWLIAEAAPGQPFAIDVALGCALPLSESRMRLRLTGPHTFDVLAACIAVDWNSPEAQPGHALQTSFHHVPVLAMRSAPDACDLLVPRSFAQSLAEWVAEVAAPHEARPARLVTA